MTLGTPVSLDAKFQCKIALKPINPRVLFGFTTFFDHFDHREAPSDLRKNLIAIRLQMQFCKLDFDRI